MDDVQEHAGGLLSRPLNRVAPALLALLPVAAFLVLGEGCGHRAETPVAVVDLRDAGQAHAPDAPDTTLAPAGDPGSDAGTTPGRTAMTAIDAGVLAPPAGPTPCAPGKVRTASAAVQQCFASRVKPALLALANDPARLERFRFGSADYLRTVLAISPHLTPAVTWDGGPSALDPRRTILGDVAVVTPSPALLAVRVLLRVDGMPVDGHTELLFLVDRRTLETVFVHRLG